MASSIFQGILQGLGESFQKHNQSVLSMEVDRRKQMADMYEKMAQSPLARPEAIQEFMNRALQIRQTPYEKKLPKELENPMDLMIHPPAPPDIGEKVTTPGASPSLSSQTPIEAPKPPSSISPFMSPEEVQGQQYRSEMNKADVAGYQAGKVAEAQAPSRIAEAIASHPPAVPREPAAVVQEYEYYANQEKQAGRVPVTFDQYQARDANRKNAAPSTPGHYTKIIGKDKWEIFHDAKDPSKELYRVRVGPAVDPSATQSEQMSERSYNARNTELNKDADPIAAGIQRMGRLLDTIDVGSPIADSVTAPELMVVMAGGQGSGVRITQAEINTIFGAQSKFEQAKAAMKQWSTDPEQANRILEPMRGQIRTLVMKVNEKLQLKQQAVEEARQRLIDTGDPKQHKQIVADAKKKLSGIDSGYTAPPAPGGHNPAIDKTAKELGITYEQAESSLRKQGLIK